MNVLELLGAAFGGGLVASVLDHLWDEWRRRRETSRTAKQLVDKYLDPILKAGNEFVAKLRWLAQNDFKELESLPRTTDSLQELDRMTDLLYLFAQFWAWIQLLRQEGVYVNLGADPSGKTLLRFVRTLEERETRILDRSWQRALGEALLTGGDGEFRVMTYFRFVEAYRSDEGLREWFEPLRQLLSKLHHTGSRQKLLVYGTIVHALIDTLDPRHLVAHERPTWANKLTKKSRRELEGRIFKEYLADVRSPERYFGGTLNETRQK